MLEWNSSLETGHSYVDDDHQQFIRILRALQVTIEAEGSNARLNELITTLYHYAMEHFSREEAYMAQVHCPAFRENRRAHQEFLDKLVAWMQLISDGAAAASLAAEIHRDSAAWIENHILSVDCHLRRCSPRA